MHIMLCKTALREEVMEESRKRHDLWKFRLVFTCDHDHAFL